jgi:hypothetical protein
MTTPHHMNTAVVEQLRLFSQDAIGRRNAFWDLHYSMMRRDNYVSIPLLVASSLTGLTSVSSASSSDSNAPLLWVTAGLGTASTFLAALQRYFRYGERAEQARHLAKSYGDLARRIEITLDMYEDGAKNWTLQDLATFADEIVQEMRKLLSETQDMPLNVLKDEYRKQLEQHERPAILVDIP